MKVLMIPFPTSSTGSEYRFALPQLATSALRTEAEGTTGPIEQPIILDKETLDRWAANHRPPETWLDSEEEDLFS